MAKKKPIIVEGFLLSVSVPTEERLSVTIDASGISWRRYRDLIYALQDQLAIIDDEYKIRETRGRGLGARYRRITPSKRTKTIKFIPYPSRFANILRTIRRDVYFEVNSRCLVLNMMHFGYFKRNIYLLPYNQAPAFMSYINEKNREIEDLNNQIEDFRRTRYFDEIREIISDAKLDTSALDDIVKIPKISVDLTPLRLDPSIVEDLIESRYKKMFERISEEEKKGLEVLRRELEEKRRELVIKSIESIRDKINVIIRRIAAEKKLKNVKKELEHLKRIAVDIGLEAVAKTVINPLIEVTENPSKAEEILGTTNISEEINGRIAGLIKTI